MQWLVEAQLDMPRSIKGMQSFCFIELEKLLLPRQFHMPSLEELSTQLAFSANIGGILKSGLPLNHCFSSKGTQWIVLRMESKVA